MNKQLPGVFANKIERAFDNTQNAFYSDRNEAIYEGNIEKKINDIFKESDFVYKAQVSITTTQGVFTKTIVGKTNNSLLTIDNEVINYSIIKDIKKI